MAADGACYLDGIQMEVDGEERPTGKFRRKRPAGTSKPAGTWPAHWVDPVHEFDGHGIGVNGEDRTGEELLRNEINALYVQNGIEVAVDDVSGSWLDPAAVKVGRDVEMTYFEKMQVYERVPRAEQKKIQGKIIGTKWIDVNKGDFDNPNIRFPLVGKEFRTGPDDALYAGTPPLEALRVMLSRAATVDAGGKERERVVNDVSGAYFYAKCTRDIYIELPPEDPKARPDMLGRLGLCLYGTRDAALNWQSTLSEHLVEIGFLQGIGYP